MALLALTLVLWLASAVGCDGPHGAAQPANPSVKVLAFTATWCGPCQRAKPALVQIETAGTEVQIIDIDEQPALAQQYRVTSVPTFIVYVGGRQVVRTQDVSVVVSWARSRSR